MAEAGGGKPRGKPERNREIYQLWMSSGMTYREIGRRYGVCPERIRQIVVRVRRTDQEARRRRETEQSEEEDA